MTRFAWLGLCLIPGCWWGTDVAPPRMPPYVRMVVPDFASAYDSGSDARGSIGFAAGRVVAIEYNDPQFLDAPTGRATLRESVRLTRDGERVTGRVVDDLLDTTGAEVSRGSSAIGGFLSFVPDEPLTPGAWYTFTVDFTSWIDTGETIRFDDYTTHRGGVAIARFRIDSLPCWTSTKIRGVDRESPQEGDPIEILGELSETIVATTDWGARSVEVRYDAVAQTCSRAFGDGGFVLVCPAPAAGVSVEIRLESDSVTDALGNTPVVHTFTIRSGSGTPSYWFREFLLPDLGLDGTP